MKSCNKVTYFCGVLIIKCISAYSRSHWAGCALAYFLHCLVISSVPSNVCTCPKRDAVHGDSHSGRYTVDIIAIMLEMAETSIRAPAAAPHRACGRSLKTRARLRSRRKITLKHYCTHSCYVLEIRQMNTASDRQNGTNNVPTVRTRNKETRLTILHFWTFKIKWRCQTYGS